MKLLGILIGFIIAMLGLIIAIHSTSHVVGLLMLFGGMYLTLSCLPAYGGKVIIMPNKHFCQGPTCHEQVTQDRFLKSKGIIRGRYAYFDRDVQNHYYGTNADKYFCSQQCKFTWLSQNMENIEHGRPIEFIRHRRETQGYAKVKNDESRWGPEYSIQRVDNRTELD